MASFTTAALITAGIVWGVKKARKRRAAERKAKEAIEATQRELEASKAALRDAQAQVDSFGTEVARRLIESDFLKKALATVDAYTKFNPVKPDLQKAIDVAQANADTAAAVFEDAKAAALKIVGNSDKVP